MDEKPKDIKRQCVATNRMGIRCSKSAMMSQKICHMHGGKAPQNIRAAKKRMLEMSDSAMIALQDALDHGDHKESVSAARIVLDRCGMGPSSTIDLNEKSSDSYSLMSSAELADAARTLAKEAEKAREEEDE
tara:strand:- start:1472 stop:1867 length:396 start_codon:yes stop_codon:yes gene_type:complete